MAIQVTLVSELRSKNATLSVEVAAVKDDLALKNSKCKQLEAELGSREYRVSEQGSELISSRGAKIKDQRRVEVQHLEESYGQVIMIMLALENMHVSTNINFYLADNHLARYAIISDRLFTKHR